MCYSNVPAWIIACAVLHNLLLQNTVFGAMSIFPVEVQAGMCITEQGPKGDGEEFQERDVCGRYVCHASEGFVEYQGCPAMEHIPRHCSNPSKNYPICCQC